MKHSRRLGWWGVGVVVAVLCWHLVPARLAAAVDLPARLTDAEFWALTDQMSEPNGYFRSDNFLSNERGYQVVIPDLLKVAKTNRVYLGVGPEQNFPYIIALKPQMAIIFDIRRGNLHEHLLYKALFEMSSDRADFLSRLWSRPRPAGLTTASSVEALVTAYRTVAPSPEAYTKNLASVLAHLTTTHHFALRPDDPEGIDYVYKTAFFEGGPDLTYSMNGSRMGSMSTYGEIQMLDDGQGVNRGFLATESNWQVMKDLHARNMLVPVVGDFGGPSAIRSVGAYLKAHDAMVSAFYLSNVEQYLNQEGKEGAFLCNVATLPLDESSTFIYTGAGRTGVRFGGGRGGLNTTFLRPMLPDTEGCQK